QNYEMVIRDYKKGRVVMESTLSPESSDSANGMTERETTEDTALAAQYRKVFEKVWAEVERIMAEMKEQLLKQLTEPWRPLDDQERTINILLELDIPDDPVWHYLDSQYNYITNLFKETYKEQVAKIEALKKSVITNDIDKRQVANNLKDTIKIISTRNFDALTARKSMDVQIWQATLVIVKTLSDLLLRCLPDFWKLSKSFAEGKFQKNQTVLSTNRRRRQAMDLDKVKEAQKMAKGVIDLYAQLLSDFFNLSSSTEDQNGTSESVQSPSSISSTPHKNSFVPPQTDSVVACYFLTKIVMEMCECVNDINAINVAAEATVALSTLMEQTRWRFVGVLCDTWINDATNFYLLEDWTLDSDNREITTILRTFHTFHKYNSRCAFKIASLGFVSDTDESKGGPSIPPEYLERIKGAFFRSIEAYLDSLPDIASDAAVERVDNKTNESIFRPRIDPTDSEATLLLTVSNLASLKQYMIPRLVSQFENAYKCKMAAEVSSINEYVDQLDEIFFADYIRLKKEAVSEIIRKGILNSGIDWYNIAKPTEVHAFVYEALLTLVMVHSQISDVSKILVNRALSELLDSMVQDCYDAFGQVERFGMGGMLQAVLDIKVMDQILAQYATPKAQEIFTNIYKKIEELYDPSQRTGNLETELNSVRGLL
ncbi:4762_t:CDS:10, partial [Paraglomus occultum]